MDDIDLVRAAKAGRGTRAGRDAAAVLLGRYQRAVYVRALRYVRDHDRALDIAQDVLLSAFEKLGSFEGRSTFASWLFSITRNRCLNEMRRVSLFSDDGHDPDAVPDERPGPLELLEEGEGAERVLAVMRAVLDPVEQKAIWLRCYERMPIDEITRILGIDEASGARGVLQTARRKLRKAMPQHS
jgi:RNA polymerase sigma-70 factor (ECF subfamily)